MKLHKITEPGRKRLGDILKQARSDADWSMDQLLEFITEKTGTRPAKSTISHLERGHNDPHWNTLSVIHSSGLVPYTVQEMFEIAAEIPTDEVADDLLIRVKRLPKDHQKRLLTQLIEAIAV